MGNAIVIGLLALAVFFAVRSVVKNRGKTCGGCGGDCSSCRGCGKQ